MKRNSLVFNPEIPPDLEHAPLIREEALDWLETHYPGRLSFVTGDVLRMAGEPARRWLITRLRARDIGNESEFSLPDTADALTILFLRSKGVKFLDAVNGVVGGKVSSKGIEPKYGGMWNRLILAAMDGLRRRVPARLLGSIVFSLIPNPEDQANCLIIVKHHGKKTSLKISNKISKVNHDYVYRLILERPAPSCSVIAPPREVMFFSQDQLPARSEITSRHFEALQIVTELESYELVLGTMKPVPVLPDGNTYKLVGRILDIIYFHFETFAQAQLLSRLETPVEPEQTFASDLQLWLITQFLTSIYANSLCEISETSPSTQVTRVLTSSVARPWEPSPWGPAKSLEMLSGYASRTGVPLVVDRVEYPWTEVIEGVDSELRYLKSRITNRETPETFSSLALPITMSSGSSSGSLYMLIPRVDKAHLETEIHILSIFSRIIGETIERHRAAEYSADVSANVVSRVVLKREQFKTALLDLLNRKARELHEESSDRDVRLPFLLVSAHSVESDHFDPVSVSSLKRWMVETLRHLEWQSFVTSHLSNRPDSFIREGFMGEVPEIGIMVALGSLVTKEELDQIRSAFPTTFNKISPTNSPVKLVAWVLDVPAQRIAAAAKGQKLPELSSEIEGWAFEVATLVDDLAQSSILVRDEGEWDAALKIIRQALRKDGSRNNSFLRRLAVDCSLALADWPSALKYAQEAVALSGRELGSGFIRSLCLEADAHLCLCDPVRAWDLYTQAVSAAQNHPLPRYYRGQAVLLMARLLRVYEDECRRSNDLQPDQEKQIEIVFGTLINAALEDLTSAADLLERWGLTPESYQVGNFHLVPTLIGQGLAYLLSRSPGPAASRLQSARRSFPKDDLFLREFIFAKCWEQGVHRQYAALLLGDGWLPLRDRFFRTFGEPLDPNLH